MDNTVSDSPDEFYPADRNPNSLVPRPGLIRRFFCKVTGHNWKRFLWGGVNHMMDCDACTKCFKFRGPLPIDREGEVFPCYMKPY